MDLTAGAPALEVIQQFVSREARYADEHSYIEWEALWTDDAIYWVPAGGPGTDPVRQMSVIYDNRTRISTRVKQLQTGRRHSQAPPSVLRRVVSNVELLDDEDPSGRGGIAVGANFVLVEWRGGESVLWAGRTTYRLRAVGGEMRMAYKKVDLVNSTGVLPTLSFLI